MWPILSDPKNMPMRLSAFGPLFAKLAVVSTPLIYFNFSKLPAPPKPKETLKLQEI
jgi:hypothetical protein